MKRHLISWSLAVLAAGGLGATEPILTETKPVTATEALSKSQSLAVNAGYTKLLEDYARDFTEAMLHGDTQRCAHYYADDLRVMPEFQGTVLGKAGAVAYFTAFAQRFAVRAYRREAVERSDLGTRVIEIGEFKLELQQGNSSRPLSLVGKYMDIWAKTKDRELALVTAIWNYDQPTDNSDIFRFSEVPSVNFAFRDHVPIKTDIALELAAYNHLLETAIVQHDFEVWSQFYSGDAMLMPSYHPICRGRTEIDAYLRGHTEHLPIFEKLDIRNDKIDESGEFVIEYATHVANWRTGDSSGVNTGKNIRIWRRQPNGSLRYFRQIGTYN